MVMRKQITELLTKGSIWQKNVPKMVTSAIDIVKIKKQNFAINVSEIFIQMLENICTLKWGGTQASKLERQADRRFEKSRVFLGTKKYIIHFIFWLLT